jgi:hypothetical protein
MGHVELFESEAGGSMKGDAVLCHRDDVMNKVDNGARLRFGSGVAQTVAESMAGIIPK